jgi:hypothetical protein
VALEQAKYGVRANCVCPGAIDTAWTRGPGGPLSLEIQKMIDGMVPLGRRGSPEEMANVFAFLASDEASYITGALLLADGGVTPAKGSPGEMVPEEFRRAPDGVLPLKHSHDGLRGKEVYFAKSRSAPIRRLAFPGGPISGAASVRKRLHAAGEPAQWKACAPGSVVGHGMPCPYGKGGGEVRLDRARRGITKAGAASSAPTSGIAWSGLRSDGSSSQGRGGD